MDLVFSDIHADINSLNKIVEIASNSDFKKQFGEFSRVINLGDVLERGTHPRAVLEKLQFLQQNYSVISVLGNHDEAFLYGRKISGSSLESIDAHSKLSKEDLEFFNSNFDPKFSKYESTDKKRGLLCVHGGPLDPLKITPKNAGDEGWLYQKNWQRLSEEEFEYFNYSGYHYKASSAFKAGKKVLNNFIILCGHQHTETALSQKDGDIFDLISTKKPIIEKFSNFTLVRKEFEIDSKNNYLIRLGLGGPQGYYGFGTINPYFGIIQYNPKKVILFEIESF